MSGQPTPVGQAGLFGEAKGRRGEAGRYFGHVSLASWAGGQADRMLERSTWGRYPMGVRVLAGPGCWLPGVAVGVMTLVLLNAPRTFIIIFVGTLGLWYGVMLAAYATGSRSAMRVTIWSIPIFGLLPLTLAFVIW
jgi:hypothetical protein